MKFFDRALLYGLCIAVPIIGGVAIYELILLYRILAALGLH